MPVGEVEQTSASLLCLAFDLVCALVLAFEGNYVMKHDKNTVKILVKRRVPGMLYLKCVYWND
jgi:hypothetical protein